MGRKHRAPIRDLDAPIVRHRKPVRSSLVWWLRFLGLVAFVVLLVRLSPGSQSVRLTRFDPRWIGLCMCLTVGQLMLEAMVWWWLLSMQRIRHSYPQTLLSYLASHYLGTVTPGHVGEFLAAGYISSEHGITFGYALSSVVVKKVLSWIAMIGFGIWALPLLAQFTLRQGAQRMVFLGIAGLLLLAAGITFWVVSLRRLARRWEKLSPWQIDMTEFWAGARQLWTARLVIPLVVATLAFSLAFFQCHAVLRSLGIILPLVLVAQIVALSRVGGRVVPFSLGGWGSKDAAIIALLGQQGIDPSVGLTVTLLLLVASHFVTLLLSGLCWWIKPLVIHRVVPSSS